MTIEEIAKFLQALQNNNYDFSVVEVNVMTPDHFEHRTTSIEYCEDCHLVHLKVN